LQADKLHRAATAGVQKSRRGCEAPPCLRPLFEAGVTRRCEECRVACMKGDTRTARLDVTGRVAITQWMMRGYDTGEVVRCVRAFVRPCAVAPSVSLYAQCACVSVCTGGHLP
jgi:hypothetical protein